MAIDALVIVQGSSVDLAIEIFDDRDVAEDLSVADAATLAVRTSLQDTAAILERSTAAGNLSIDAAGSRLVATLTTPESAALVPGAYVGQAAIRFGDDDSWKVTDPFEVRVKRKAVATA